MGSWQSQTLPEEQNDASNIATLPVGPRQADVHVDHRNTKCNEILLAETKVDDICVTQNPYLNKVLVCSDGRKIYYNDTALMIILGKLGVSELWPPRFKQTFLIDVEEIEDVMKIVRENTPANNAVNRMKNAVLDLMNLENIVKNKKDKKIYIRYFSPTPFDRELNRWVFKADLMNAAPVLLEQQGSRYDEEAVEKYWRETTRENEERVTISELNAILESFNVNKSLITLVPDINYADSILNEMTIAPGYPMIAFFNPEKQLVTEQLHAIFQVFQQVICDVDWANEEESKGSKEALRSLIFMKLFEISRPRSDGLMPVELLEGMINELKTSEPYLQLKRKNILTPLIKIHDCEFMDGIPVLFFEAECRKYRLNCASFRNHAKKDRVSMKMNAWKARLLFLTSWNDMFFTGDDQNSQIYNGTVNLGIHHRAPIVDWENEGDFTVVLEGTNPLLNAKCELMSLEDLRRLKPAATHDWLQGTSWMDRKYIRRCRKWGIRHALEATDDGNLYYMGYVCQIESENLFLYYNHAEKNRPGIQEQIDNLKRQIERGVVEKAPEAVAAEQEVEVVLEKKETKNLTSQATRGASSKAQKTKAVKKTVPDTQNSKRNNSPSTSASSSTSNAQNPQKESAVCDKCFRTNEAHNSTRIQLTSAQNQAKKWEKKYLEAEKELKAFKDPGEGKKSWEEMEKELKKANKEVEQFKKREASLIKQTDDLKKMIEVLKAELERKSTKYEDVIETVTSERDRWEASKVESDSRIKLLKENIPQDVLANLNIRLNTEMRENLIYLQNEQDRILAEDPIGKASDQVREFSTFHKDHPEEQGWAQHELLEFQQQHTTYLNSVVERIEKIQADPLITQAEYKEFPHPEQPGFSQRLTKAMEEARESVNEELEKQCCICHTDEEKEWFKCPLCLKQGMHLDCVADWWCEKGQQVCPLCIRVVG